MARTRSSTDLAASSSALPAQGPITGAASRKAQAGSSPIGENSLIAGASPGRGRSRRGGQAKQTYLTVTETGADAIPLATTTRLLGPAGVVDGRVNLVEDEVPGAIETDVHPCVRA